MTTEQTFVIVGASLAGAAAAEALRSRGFDGRVVLVGEEPARPYERPPLSKGYLAGQSGLDKVYVHEAGFYADRSIELRTGTTVVGLDPERSVVTLAGGETIPYDRLLLATGAAPRRLAVPGANLPGVHYLRTLADADNLAAAADEASSVAVIGAGWVGSEVAATLRQRGLPVALVEPAATPLERVLGREVGGIYRDLHADHGVALHLGQGAASLHGGDRVEEVRTTGGARIAADLVVVGVGAVPRTELAAGAGLLLGNGVLVDEYLQSSHPGIFAAGDVASAWHPWYRTHVRVEHWANACHQGAAAAASMMGVREPYERVPYFFSDQYDLGMEYTGYCPTWDQVVLRGDPAGREFIAFWLAGGQVVAGMNANVWDVGETLRELVTNRPRVEPARLADVDVPLEGLAAEVTRA
ncbi:MAG TPA: FAD-dependent oxidoreductase [Pilimelia sp.]|nr:FAD-dependent oxidoreductase [Pilimelia sp.]